MTCLHHHRFDNLRRYVQDDLVCIPHKAAAALGGFGPLALCTRVSNTLTLTDPQTLRSIQMDVSCFMLPSLLLLHAPSSVLAIAAVCFSGWHGKSRGSQCVRAKLFRTAQCLLAHVIHHPHLCQLLSQANQYWRQPFTPVLNSRQLAEFVVLDVELAGPPTGRFVLADVQVCMGPPSCEQQTRPQREMNALICSLPQGFV